MEDGALRSVSALGYPVIRSHIKCEDATLWLEQTGVWPHRLALKRDVQCGDPVFGALSEGRCV